MAGSRGPGQSVGQSEGRRQETPRCRQEKEGSTEPAGTWKCGMEARTGRTLMESELGESGWWVMWDDLKNNKN